jgi:hypothetical protein
MKTHTKGKIRHLINLEEEDGLKKSLARLNKRFQYLKSKRKKNDEPSNQMKYIQFHIKKLKKMAS